MSVLLETSKGDLVIDLHTDQAPVSSTNFLKLCKVKYFNNCLFHNVQQDFVVQTGDPTGLGTGGESIFGKLSGDPSKRFFSDEIRPSLKHVKKGTVSWIPGGGEDTNASQLLITTRDDCDALDGKHTIFGQVAEGFDVLDLINESYCDSKGRPFQNIRIRHTLVLGDPFEDPPGLENLIPDASPQLKRDPNDTRLEDDWRPTDNTNVTEEQLEKTTRQKEAKNRAVVLEMIGDLPEADAKPPPESLFICKLNPITSDEDLEIIFSRFGKVKSCDIVRDHKTGDSLGFGFITFDNEKSAETAYFKMDNVLIDDRRVKVDFSQSMHGLWRNFKKNGASGGTAADATLANRGGAGGGAVRGSTHGGGGGSGYGGRHQPSAFRSGDGRSTLEIKGSVMGHICGGRGVGGSAPRSGDAGRPGDRDREERQYDDQRRGRDRDRDRDRNRRDRSRSRSRSRDRDERRKDKKHKRDRSRSPDRHSRKDKKHKKDRRDRSRSRDRSDQHLRRDRSRSRDREREKRRERSRSRDRDRDRGNGRERVDKKSESIRDGDGVIKQSAGGLEVRRPGGLESSGSRGPPRQDGGRRDAYDY